MLDSGLDGGLELPFTCRGGICGACVGRVTEGEVDMSDVRARWVYLFVNLCMHMMQTIVFVSYVDSRFIFHDVRGRAGGRDDPFMHGTPCKRQSRY